MAADETLAIDKIQQLVRVNPRYPREAYEFISEALAYTARHYRRDGHVSGQELCHGCRMLALERFGYLARTVLESWNVKRTDDFGHLVYGMIEAGLLRKTEQDSLDDFRGVYDFREAFDTDFRIVIQTNE